MITTSAQLIHKYDSPSGLVSYVLFRPEELFSFQEGQFCMIEIERDEKKLKKPYSIATTNSMLQNEGLLGVIVKKTSEHGVSDYLTQRINEGDHVILRGPVGHYVDPHNHPNYLLIAIGSGLSPNFGLFQYLIFESQKDVRIINIVGEKNRSHLVPQVYNRFLQGASAQVHHFFCLSQETELEAPYISGRVQTVLDQAVSFLGTNTTCFVCGSPEAVQDIVNKLGELGIAREDIIVEKY